MENKFVVFEGIDGVGKSTLCLALKHELEKRGIRVVLYDSLENKKIGFNKIKSFVKTGVRPLSMESSLYFYLSSSLYKSAVIKKLLEKTWVICDRYVYSTIADHVVEGVNKSFVPNLNKFSFLKPDFAYWVKVDDNIRLPRIKQRGNTTKSDLVLNIHGTRAHNMEKEFSKMGLVEIKNNGSFIQTLNYIIGDIFKKTRN